MPLTTRGRRQATRLLFPGSYFVFRNLSLQVPDGGVTGSPVPFSILARIMPSLVAQIRAKQRDPAWRRFMDVTEDRFELVEPGGVNAEVAPTTWWCSSCQSLFNGPLRRVGIRGGECPQCHTRPVVQLATVFMCPQCHEIEPLEAIPCRDCRDSRSVILVGSGGRRREYRWRCRQHPEFEQYVRRMCRRDGTRMVLKSTGGSLYSPARLSHVEARPGAAEAVVRGRLSFRPARATVVEVVIGRIPIADFGSYARGAERSIVEPFMNPRTGNYVGLVARLETDALTVTVARGDVDPMAVHSVEHALLNAAPAVTGLTQDEFGTDLQDEGRSVIIYDSVAGGTGGCRLLGSRRLDRWLAVAHELAECHHVQCEDACRACLFLPSRICRVGNVGLNRHAVLTLLPG